MVVARMGVWGKGQQSLAPAYGGPGARLALRSANHVLVLGHSAMLMGRNIVLGTHFDKLNKGWDAEAGAPEPKLHTDASGLTLTFFLSSSLNPKFRKYDRGEIFFSNCWRYRLGYP